MCRGNLALEFRLEKVVPGLRNLEALFFKNLLVRAESQNTDVDTGPVVLRVLVLIRDFLSGGRIIGLDQALLCGCTVAVNRATMPDIKLWVILRRVQTSNGLTGGKANVGCLDSGLLREGLCPLLAEVFHCATSDSNGIRRSAFAAT